MSITIDSGPDEERDWVGTRAFRVVVVATLTVILAVLAWRLMHIGKAHEPNGDTSIPLVTVASVGVSAAPTVVAITGTISARYDLSLIHI